MFAFDTFAATCLKLLEGLARSIHCGLHYLEQGKAGEKEDEGPKLEESENG